jgi:arylformamidase
MSSYSPISSWPDRSWVDLSVPVRNGMVHWPDDPEYHIDRTRDYARGDELVLSHISLGVHTGTHMDAPLHFVRGGETIDHIPLDATVGEARVIEIRDPESVKSGELREAGVKAGERILLKTANSAGRWATDEFQKDFVYIARDGAEYLASVGIRSVGVDYLSVGGFFKDGPETHRALLGAGIWVIEGLNLAPVRSGRYELVCLPLKLVGAEGAPARAIARPVVEAAAEVNGI